MDKKFKKAVVGKPVDDLFNDCVNISKKALKEIGDIPFTIIVIDDKCNKVVLTIDKLIEVIQKSNKMDLITDNEGNIDKRKICAIYGKFLAEMYDNNFIGFCQLSTAWMASSKKEIPDVPPSQDKNKKEVVIVAGMDIKENVRLEIRQIVRDKNDNILRVMTPKKLKEVNSTGWVEKNSNMGNVLLEEMVKIFKYYRTNKNVKKIFKNIDNTLSK